MNDFLIQSGANFLGTVFGGCLLYRFLEGRFKKIDKEEKIQRLFKNFYGESVTNYIVLERIIEKGNLLLDNDDFPVARLKTKATTDFLYTRPVPGNKIFYDRLRATVMNMEMKNSLIDLIFSQTNPQAILQNKTKIIRTVPKTLDEINTILYNITVFNEKYKFIEEAGEFKPAVKNKKVK